MIAAPAWLRSFVAKRWLKKVWTISRCRLSYKPGLVETDKGNEDNRTQITLKTQIDPDGGEAIGEQA